MESCMCAAFGRCSGTGCPAYFSAPPEAAKMIAVCPANKCTCPEGWTMRGKYDGRMCLGPRPKMGKRPDTRGLSRQETRKKHQEFMEAQRKIYDEWHKAAKDPTCDCTIRQKKEIRLTCKRSGFKVKYDTCRCPEE